jgi:long-chain acyl-CoA synthetase
MNLAALLLDVARRQPDSPAITEGGNTLSYAALAAHVGAIAGALRGRGLRPGDRVVLWMENCTEFLECLFACWSAGLCAVPVNAKLHALEARHIIEDCGALLVLTTPGLAGDALEAAEHCPVVCTRTEAFQRLVAGPPVEPHGSDPADLAWIFYTSGTTGRPKGAMLTHRALLAMSLMYYADVDPVGPKDIKLHMAPLSHASGLYSLPFFLKGAHHVVLPGFDLDAMAEVLGRFTNVTFFAAPTMLTRLVNSPVAAALDPRRIKTIYYGGGPMYVADLERALGVLGPRLFQIYGQGESPMTIAGLPQAMHVDASGAPDPARLASCGVARTGVQIRVVDDADCELPPGEVGEVITRSDCVMSGYWGNAAATASTLKDGWLRTGDIGSLSGHGILMLLDRSKDMIISGGSNIYPREVEEVLLRHPGLAEVSVIGRPHADWGEEVVAFVVPKPGHTAPTRELDQLCLESIARFKRPKRYEIIEALPKNNYGKVLKTELRHRLAGENAP